MSIDYDFIKVQVSFLVFRYKGASKLFLSFDIKVQVSFSLCWGRGGFV